MTMQIFTVYDSAAGAYLQPFFAPTIEFAIRQFRQAVNAPDHHFGKFPDDFTLFSLGSFDQSTCVWDLHEPVSLGVAITFVDRIELVEDEEVS